MIPYLKATGLFVGMVGAMFLLYLPFFLGYWWWVLVLLGGAVAYCIYLMAEAMS